jgi:hypothetical protein
MTSGQIRCCAELRLIVIAPEHFNQIRMHLYPPSSATVLLDRTKRSRHGSENLAAGVCLVGYRFDAKLICGHSSSVSAVFDGFHGQSASMTKINVIV